MIFTETPLQGAYLIDLKRIEDSRGFFARSWCQNEFSEYDLETNLAQCNISFNAKKDTLRGMHYQAEPYAEAKLVRCTMGAIYDVIIDLRPNSKTFKDWFGVELTAENRRSLYIPKGFAHGFQTLMDNSEVFYQMSAFFHPESTRGLRWDDSDFRIEWPYVEKRIISNRDKNLPLFSRD